MSADAMRKAVSGIEDLGFRTLWFPESFAREAFAQGAMILAASERLIAASGIANLLARDATAMINGARTLEEAYPDRLLLGVGVSHGPSAERRGTAYTKPLSMMVDYLDGMENALYVGPPPAHEPTVVLAALGPKMLKLAAERTAGAHPYFVPVEHTSIAREIMGSEALLAPEQAVVLTTNADEARAIAREHTVRYLALPNYRNNLLRLGWTETDTADAGSDALVDAVVAWGSIEAIRDRVAAHLNAGADHVGVQVLNGPPREFPINELRELAPALLELG
jgi:probable F420-dependent oxidoreductase